MSMASGKKAAGLLLALAGSAPALADTGDREMRPRSDGLPASAVAGRDIETALAEGRSLLVAGNAAQAISAFRLALAQDSMNVAALNGIAIAYDRMGRIDLARQHFEQALSIEPDAADIAYNLGWTLHRAGQSRAAIAWLQRASGGSDGRAAAAARRALLLVAAALEAGAAVASPADAAPVRVAAARIDMASSGEAVLVLPGAVAHPATSARAVVPAPAARLAGGVPTARIAGTLRVAGTDVPQLAAPITLAADDDEAAVSATATAVVETRLGDLATLTIPLATLAVADAPSASALPLALPQVISVGDAPPELARHAAHGDLAAVATVQPLHMAPLRLLDLAALPELATATPMLRRPFAPVAGIAVDWFAGFDSSRFAEDPEQRAHRRLTTALSAQAELSVIADSQAVRLAIARLEALVARIGDLRA